MRTWESKAAQLAGKYSLVCCPNCGEIASALDWVEDYETGHGCPAKHTEAATLGCPIEVELRSIGD